MRMSSMEPLKGLNGSGWLAHPFLAPIYNGEFPPPKDALKEDEDPTSLPSIYNLRKLLALKTEIKFENRFKLNDLFEKTLVCGDEPSCW